MTKEDIIRMAQEAGIEYSKNLNQIVSPYCDGVHMDDLEKFINLVAATEREACAELIPPQYFELRDRIRAREQ
jgi:hypothetical protein